MATLECLSSNFSLPGKTEYRQTLNSITGNL
jgi:hypothetical protein